MGFYNERVVIHSRESGGGTTMGLLIAAGILLFCFLATWAVLRRPVRQIVEDVRVEHARTLFHRNRERLEARFVTTLERSDPDEAERWETAQWDDEVLWARDRHSHRLLALTCVEFEPEPFELSFGHSHATAIFEFRKGSGVPRASASTRCGRKKRSVFFGGSRRFESRRSQFRDSVPSAASQLAHDVAHE